MAFLTDADKAALAAAATAIEARSSAEIVIVIRAQSDPYVHADLLAGIAAGVLLLWFQLFSPWEFTSEGQRKYSSYGRSCSEAQPVFSCPARRERGAS